VEPLYIILLAALVLAVLWLARRRPALPESPDSKALPRTKASTTTAPSDASTNVARVDREVGLDSESRAASAASTTSASAVAAGRPSRDIDSLRKGMSKMRESTGFFGRLKELIGGAKSLDPRLVEDIEEVLITSDVGTKTTEKLLESIRRGLEKKELANPERVWAELRQRATELLDLPGGGAIRETPAPTVVLVVGVNGAGKTTTIGKLATKLGDQGKRVLLVAGDTFRAAAVQQVQAWGSRTQCEVFAGKEGADPASVVFDAIQHARDARYDVVLCDTAGRLHTKSPLMDELRKVHRTTQKVLEGAPHEVLLVVDGTSGQNAVQQAAEFGGALPLTGIVLTKLDGTAKGGVVLAIAHEQRIPVRYVGVGERAEDLREFDAADFVEALLGNPDDPGTPP
jgi:fused signal recognition particle receptor